MMDKAPTAIPDTAQGEERDQLIEMRATAQEAHRAALELAQRASVAKRRARQLIKRYEELVSEHNGQLTIYDALEEVNDEGDART